MLKTPKNICCGCEACCQACPKNCIEMIVNKKGFLYPKVDNRLCIDCDLCNKVCPAVEDVESRPFSGVYAAKNDNAAIRLKSSSGGIFSVLAEYVIKNDGVVFGTRWNERFEAVVDWTETIEGIGTFRGSKYVQSRIGNSYNKTKGFLDDGRLVLFSGTPCQIMGLKHFLRKEYDNLLTLEVICHGVPSPKVWQEYLSIIIRPLGGDGKNTVSSSLKLPSVVTGVNFRDKTNGWKKFGFRINYCSDDRSSEQNSVFESTIGSFIESFDQNEYMRAFLSNLTLRPSCFNCKAKAGNSGADITIGDLWGVDKLNPEIDEDKGLSLIILHSKKAKNIFDDLNVNLLPVGDEYVTIYNPSYLRSVEQPYLYEYFWWQFKRHGINALTKTRRYHPSLFYRFYKRIKRVL